MYVCVLEGVGGGPHLVEHLAQIHDDGLVHLLPQVGPEDLDEGDLQRGDLAVHEDARQVQLHLRPATPGPLARPTTADEPKPSLPIYASSVPR